jgi:citrate lyase beta subunit
MLKTYLFIPANRHDFLANIHTLKSDFFVIDFEESIATVNKTESFETLPSILIEDTMYARPFFTKTKEHKIETDFFILLVERGFRKFIIPKIDTLPELEQIAQACPSNIENLSFILLVESPRCLLQLPHILENTTLHIEAVALGSHDFALAMKMEHTAENIFFAQHQVLCIARAFDIACIDIASMDIAISPLFIEECKKAVSLGFNGKFLIHPKQIEAIHSIQWFTSNQISEAIEVYEEYLKYNENDFSLLKLHGKVYEKPHIQRIKKIIDWSKTYGNK